MADTTKTRYDESLKTMWVYRKFGKPKTLVPSDELKTWAARQRDGQTDDGRPLAQVNYVFAHRESAAYNAQPLKFSKLGVYVGDLDDPEAYSSDDGDASFDTREDFGIE